MSKPHFDVVSRARFVNHASAAKGWHRVGRAWLNAGVDGKHGSVSIRLDSLPPLDSDLKLFPPPDQAPAQCCESFRVVAPITITVGQRAEETFWHKLGIAYYNPPTDDRPENFRLLLASLPLDGRAVMFPSSDPEETEES